MRRIACIVISFIFMICLLPAVAETTTVRDGITYSYPSSPSIQINKKYKAKSYENLDACIYKYKDNYYILVDAEDSDGNVTEGLMNCTIQDSVIHEDGKPDVLVTVLIEKGFVKNTSKVIKTHDHNHDHTHTPAVTGTPSTPSPTQKPTTPPATQKPGTTQSPTPTAKPTEKPTATNTPAPSYYTCPYCGEKYAFESALKSHIASEHSSTPTPTPKPTPTPEPTPSGHWEDVWVVDQEQIDHTEYVCNVCGKHFRLPDKEDAFWADQSAHMHEDPPKSGWHAIWVVDVPEQGHWERVWVPDP